MTSGPGARPSLNGIGETRTRTPAMPAAVAVSLAVPLTVRATGDGSENGVAEGVGLAVASDDGDGGTVLGTVGVGELALCGPGVHAAAMKRSAMRIAPRCIRRP